MATWTLRRHIATPTPVITLEMAGFISQADAFKATDELRFLLGGEVGHDVTVQLDLRKFDGYDKGARSAWVTFLRQHKNKLREVVFVGFSNALLRVAVTAAGLASGVRFRLAAAPPFP